MTMRKETTDPGNKSAAEIEREVKQQRADVERTLDAIQERLSPGQLIDEAMTYLREGSGAEFMRNLGEAIKRNPMPVALIGVGVAWMMVSASRRSDRTYWIDDEVNEFDELDELDAYEARAYPAAEAPYDPSAGSSAYGAAEAPYDASAGGSAYAAPADEAGATGSSYRAGGSYHRSVGACAASEFGPHDAGSGDEGADMGERAKAAAASAREKADELRQRAWAAAGDARAGVDEMSERARARAGEMGTRARSGMARARRNLSSGASQTGAYARRYGRRAQRGFLNTLDEQPLVLGAIGLAIGAALGSLLPHTEREDRLLGETRDELKRRAFETGREQVAKAEAAAGAAYDAAREEARRQGLTPEGGREAMGTARDKVERVAGAAASAAKDEAGRQGLGQTGGDGSSTTTG